MNWTPFRRKYYAPTLCFLTLLFVMSGRLLRTGTAFFVKPTKTAYISSNNKIKQNRICLSSSSSPPETVAIIGGGLAGLSTAYHLLDKLGGNVRITVIDKAEPGQGGASSVAGGLLHPLSPKGKLLHFGIEGLEATNRLISAAQVHNPRCIITERIFRVALTEQNVIQLKSTAKLHPQFATWVDPDEIEMQCGTKCLGGLMLSNGCKVVHVPDYLQGLWCACQDMAKEHMQWCTDVPSNDSEWIQKLSQYHTVVFSAGSGLFQDSLVEDEDDESKLPVELVRGQSIIMRLDEDDSVGYKYMNQALLCGKYITPVNGKNRLLIGATHEYKDRALDHNSVLEELMAHTYDLLPCVWDRGSIEKITSGFRVQSQRGQHGRVPIVGKYERSRLHRNAYLFTGLSSRGLIYHGFYGDLLSSSIIEGSDRILREDHRDVLWWKT